MFDHIGVGVSDLKASKAFLQALSPLGVGVVMEVSDAAGLGRGQKPSCCCIRPLRASPQAVR